MNEKPVLNITEEMNDLARKLAIAGMHYDKAQKDAVHAKGPFAYNSKWAGTKFDAAVTEYKGISEPLFARAKEANPELFPQAEGSDQHVKRLDADRTLKSLLNKFVTNTAKEMTGVQPSNFYYYVNDQSQGR